MKKDVFFFSLWLLSRLPLYCSLLDIPVTLITKAGPGKSAPGTKAGCIREKRQYKER